MPLRVLAALLSAALAAAIACHHDPEPAKPAETPPLPSSTGTPVGFLLDDKAQLHLTDDQVGQLQNIDRQLQDQLKGIDTRMTAASKAAQAGSGDPQPQSMGRHRGGGMGGGMGGGGRGRGGGGGGGSGTHRGSGAPAGSVNQLGDQRAAMVHDALTRSLAVLDPAQQTNAKQILSDHDIDLDTDHPATPADDETPGYGGIEGGEP
jgi:hypothetical protein